MPDATNNNALSGEILSGDILSRLTQGSSTDAILNSIDHTVKEILREQRNADGRSPYRNQPGTPGKQDKDEAASAKDLERKFDDLFGKYSKQMQQFTDVLSRTSLGQSNGKKDIVTSSIKTLGKISTTASQLSAALSGMEGTLGAVGTAAGTIGEALSIFNGPIGILATLGWKFQQMLLAPFKAAGKAFLAYLMGPAIKGLGEALDAYSDAIFRESNSTHKNIQDARERMKADVETMVKQPFDILNKAAEEWYAAWDNNLKTITATQGYTKADVQALAASYATRLRDEGLTSVISSSDIINNLSSVLKSGLSGVAAEEFAYVATILNQTIPTQDFFSYAADYASIAANAIAQGATQVEAIAEATAQLTSFANSILTASRATGGLTTGLQDAEALFQQSVAISQTAGINDSRNLGGLLTTVAATTGAIAPDLASAITEAVYNAAVGGNSSQYVALRSLAGINASNTEFLRALSTNPQKVFGELFKNLAEMQNMSRDAFMEVAEGLAEVFGVPMSALARVDFNLLAEAILNYSSASSSLADNIALLKSGETTTTAEQLKIQQINKVILDEGLSYVLDNEAARTIQQHMWEEQFHRESLEATYGVEVKGALLEAVEEIALTVKRVQRVASGQILNDAVKDLIRTTKESNAQQSDIAQMLELGKVGAGNRSSMFALTTYDRDLNIVEKLVDMMGGTSAYGAVQSSFAADLRKRNFGANIYRGIAAVTQDSLFSLLDLQGSSTAFNPYYGESSNGYSSVYSWGTIGKSQANAISFMLNSTASTNTNVTKLANTVSATSLAQAKTEQNLERMLASLDESARAGMSYEDYEARAKEFGIANFADALKDAGYAISNVQDRYETIQAQIGAEKEATRKAAEEKFWLDNTNLLSNISDFTGKLYDSFTKFMSEWEDYFIKHSVYNAAYTADSVDKIMRSEKENSETAIYALADALTENNVNLLVDPTLQTNALLSQILKVANAILNQQSTGGAAGVSLPDTLAGLSLGLIQ